LVGKKAAARVDCRFLARYVKVRTRLSHGLREAAGIFGGGDHACEQHGQAAVDPGQAVQSAGLTQYNCVLGRTDTPDSPKKSRPHDEGG
jgi:hypothetical protein